MELLRQNSVLSELCILKKKWGIYLSFSFSQAEPYEELLKAAPYLEKFPEGDQLFMDDFLFIFFYDEQSMRNIYLQTVGDDGPTKLNSYDGPARVYALTCNPQGVLLTENT